MTTAFVGVFAVYDRDRRSTEVVEEHQFICGFVAPCTFDDVVFCLSFISPQWTAKTHTPYDYKINTTERDRDVKKLRRGERKREKLAVSFPNKNISFKILLLNSFRSF